MGIKGDILKTERIIYRPLPSYPELWSYQLLHKAIEFIGVQDFTVCLVYRNSRLTELLQQKGLISV